MLQLDNARRLRTPIRSRSKYGNIRTKEGAFHFDSLAEKRFYDELVLRQKAREIAMFLCQVPIRLKSGVIYRIDFIVWYTDHPAVPPTLRETTVFYDVKGRKTAMYETKKRMVEAEFPLEIIEVDV